MTHAMERRSGADAPEVNGPHRTRKPWPVEFYSTAVGKKWVMALTGVGLMGFVFAHMFGNLKMFIGRTAFDEYAHGLRTLFHPILPNQWVLWGLRIGLIVMVIFHIHSAYTLTRMNQRARPIKYQSPRDYIAVTFASRTMRWTGIIIFLFVLFHLADLTFGWANPDFVTGDAYDNLVRSFERPLVAVLYVICNIALGLHLFHGSWSIFQSMGLNNPRYNGARRGFAAAFAITVAGINCVFPIAVQAGLVH
ncbi:MAG: succinate dehydrogenase cytochrome b subunit [Microthrixaceae bacterium]